MLCQVTFYIRMKSGYWGLDKIYSPNATCWELANVVAQASRSV